MSLLFGIRERERERESMCEYAHGIGMVTGCWKK
jgi:hypothetical protein